MEPLTPGLKIYGESSKHGEGVEGVFGRRHTRGRGIIVLVEILGEYPEVGGR